MKDKHIRRVCHVLNSVETQLKKYKELAEFRTLLVLPQNSILTDVFLPKRCHFLEDDVIEDEGNLQKSN